MLPMFQIISYDIICLLYYGMRVHCIVLMIFWGMIQYSIWMQIYTQLRKIVEYLVYQSQKLTPTTTTEPSTHGNL